MDAFTFTDEFGNTLTVSDKGEVYLSYPKQPIKGGSNLRAIGSIKDGVYTRRYITAEQFFRKYNGVGISTLLYEHASDIGIHTFAFHGMTHYDEGFDGVISATEVHQQVGYGGVYLYHDVFNGHEPQVIIPISLLHD